MLSYFAEELDANKKKGLRNEVSSPKLLQGDLAEAWREADGEYATVAMRYSIIDATVEAASGRVVVRQQDGSGGGHGGVDLPRPGTATPVNGSCRRSSRLEHLTVTGPIVAKAKLSSRAGSWLQGACGIQDALGPRSR